MNQISNNGYGRIYSQHSIKDGEKFLNFVKKVNQDCYKKNQEEIAHGTDVFSNFLKKAKADAQKLKVKQYIARLFSKALSEIEVANLTIVSNDKSKAKSKSLRNFTNTKINAAQQKNPEFKPNRTWDDKQIEYFENKSRKLLDELEKETPIIVGSEKRHVISENELKALVIIVFCNRFKIKINNKKYLKNRIVYFDFNSDGKKISLQTAQNYVHIIKNLINKHINIRYNLSDANILSGSEFKMLDSLVKNELSKLKKI